jgi:hypothetical protein
MDWTSALSDKQRDMDRLNGKYGNCVSAIMFPFVTTGTAKRQNDESIGSLARTILFLWN